MIALVIAFERRAFDRLIIVEVSESDQATVRGHGIGEQVSGFALVEIAGAETRDALEGAGELGLAEVFLPIVEGAVLQKNPLRFGELRKQIFSVTSAPGIHLRL